MSPRSLSKDSPWWPTLCDLAKMNLISVLCVDEAHKIEQSGRSFRPEFGFAMENIQYLHDIMERKCPRILMSATFRKIDQRTCVRYLGQEPGKVIWTEMSRRRIFFDVQISGNPSASVRSSLKVDYQTHLSDANNNNSNESGRPMKVIIYTNSKKKAEESLTPSAEKVLDSLGIEGEVMPLTGDCGIMQKVFLMAAFCGDATYNNEDRDDDDNYELPHLLVMPATSAANCGVSSKDCSRSYRRCSRFVSVFLQEIRQPLLLNPPILETQ